MVYKKIKETQSAWEVYKPLERWKGYLFVLKASAAYPEKLKENVKQLAKSGQSN